MPTNEPFLSAMKPFLQDAWKKAGFKGPTSIQIKSTPLILEGKNVIAESPTGTGKTLAYLLPLLQRINLEINSPQAVILAPSRELVMQIFEQTQKWAEGSGIAPASFIGGANIKRQLEKLKKHPQVIVGTSGRVLELIKLKKLKMHEVKTIVMDEGDQLLVPEHIDTIKNIIKTTLNDRQLLLFSATLPNHIEQLAKDIMDQAEIVKVNQTKAAKSKVEHIYFVCEAREKIEVLRKIMRTGSLKALAFVKDIGNLSVLAEKLQYKGIPAGVLHSEAKKSERETALKNFRAGKYPLLLATDVAARGLDIEGLTHVIHVDFPESVTQYVHRSGRTGRQGSSGIVISIVTPREERDLKKFCRECQIPVHRKILFKGQITDKKPGPNRSNSNKRTRKRH
ncbi:DEAD/DEAH box helicase [Scopulibacillus cellulosilyticus]|uniref:DEAD/DEAH box helicase n=1 Tax=Scopulibacillus cellulosilyticus TaxID=2665665 RepID=A0ABW2PYM4_9BACL